ncbi:MAG: thioredoxin-dependent thiol peroxidase [Anaerolineae bacterium]|nr:thioredoxin-dependent thiol peroxidase [Anaerolineae bacterium]
MLQTGQPAPDFTLLDDTGQPVSLADFRGQQVVIYFYPKADTPGCTTQACALRDNWVQIEAGSMTVIGISPDQPAALAKFRNKYNLPFILLSDPDHQVASMYGAWGEKKNYGKVYEGIIRSHFGVDQEGNLIDVELKVKPETTADLALRLLSI